MGKEDNFSMESQSGKTIIYKFADGISGIISLLVIANFYGAAGLGLYYLVESLATIVSRPGNGMGVAVEKYTSVQEQDINGLSSTAVAISLLYMLIVFMISSIIYYIFSVYMNSINITLNLFLAGFAVFATLMVFSILNRAYSGLGNPSGSVLIDTYRGVIQTILQLIFVYFTFRVYTFLVASAIATVFGIIYIVYKSNIQIAKPSMHHAHKIYAYGQWSIPTEISKSVYDRVNTILIGILLTPAAVGIYESAIRILEPARYFSYSISRPLLIGSSYAEQNDEDLNHLVNKFTPYALIISIPLFVGSFITAFDLIDVLYNDEFADSAYILIGGAFAYIFYTQTDVLSGFVHGINKPEIATKELLIGNVVRILSAIVFLTQFGIYGIIPTIILSDIIRYIAINYGLMHINITYTPTKIRAMIQSSFYMLITIIMLDSIIPAITFKVLFTISIGAIIYISSLVYMNEELRYFIRQNIKTIVE